MLGLRSAQRRAHRAATAVRPQRRAFQLTPTNRVAVGDSLPDVELVESSPGNKVSLARELRSGPGLIISVPAAFSPSCSQRHVPGYIAHPRLRDAGPVFVVSVNDPFVMKAWGETLDPEQKSGIRFLGDPHGTFTAALELAFDGAVSIFGQARSRRCALVVQDGRVAEIHVEPDNTGVDVSSAEKVLGTK